MNEFKFFQSKPLIVDYEGECIYDGEVFYSMNKRDLLTYTRSEPVVLQPKYTIVRRTVSKEYQNKFEPNHNSEWYFKTREVAEYYKTMWEWEDKGHITYERV